MKFQHKERYCFWLGKSKSRADRFNDFHGISIRWKLTFKPYFDLNLIRFQNSGYGRCCCCCYYILKIHLNHQPNENWFSYYNNPDRIISKLISYYTSFRSMRCHDYFIFFFVWIWSRTDWSGMALLCNHLHIVKFQALHRFWFT